MQISRQLLTQVPLTSVYTTKKGVESLQKYEDQFDSTLGDWNTEPATFELNEVAKPYNGRAYLVLQAHKALS